MKKQIILTIIIGIALALLIYKITYHEEMKILALGDSTALGMTYYNVEGYSFNDYLKDYFEKNSILREYNKDFVDSQENSKSLLAKINNNEKLESTNLTIQQAINEAKIITIAIGMEELNNLKEIKSKNIEQYLSNINKILKQIRIFNKKEIFLLSLYPSSKVDKDETKKINQELEKISNNNNCKFINIENITDNNSYLFKPNSYYLNYKGHRYISEQIISNLD